MLNRSNLHPYQHRMVDFMRDTPRCACWVDMGLGKTVSTLTLLADLFNDFEIGKVLIIAPKRVAAVTWPDEINSWSHTRELSYTVIRGSADRRMQQLSDDNQLHIINRELTPWLIETLGKRWPYDTVVIDESSSFKSASAKRFKSLKKALPEIDRLIELTGTPTSSNLLDLWSQIFLIDSGEGLGRTFTQYKRRYFEQDYMGYNWTPKLGAEEQIYDAISDLILRLDKEDYLSLPERLDKTETIELPASASRLYEELERDFLIKLKEETVEAQNAAVLTGKLLQCANGALYTDESGKYEVIHDAKLDALAEIVEFATSPVLVAYNFKSDLERLLKRFPQVVKLDGQETVERWNAGEIPMLLAHPASAGHGLNLQHGGNIIVWFGLNWSLELDQQFNARLHRQGQTKPVMIYRLVMQNTVDETVMQALSDKGATQRNLLDAMKQDIERRLDNDYPLAA